MGYRLGVDLGTTFTAVAVANGQPPTMLGLGNRSLQVPSVLFLKPDGSFLVGEAAERRGALESDRVAREFKRRLGDHVPLLLAGIPYSAQALTAHLLRWVVDQATAQLGEPPTDTTITHPASWGPYRKELLQQVIALADVGPAHTCPEPVAAAVQYSTHSRVPVGVRLAVYDLGGGTFDVCVLDKTDEGFTIVGAAQGIERLGGVDFDEAVFRHVVASVEPVVRDLDIGKPEALAALARLRRDCVEAKEALSADVDVVVPVNLPGLSASVRVTRSDLESLIRPALELTVEAVERCLRSAKVSASDLHAIVLVGGSSRIPLVTQMLRAAFEVPTALDTHPKHDVALGAVQVRSAATGGAGPTPPPMTDGDVPGPRSALPTAARSQPTPAGEVPAPTTLRGGPPRRVVARGRAGSPPSPVDRTATPTVPAKAGPPSGRPSRALVLATSAAVVIGVGTVYAVTRPQESRPDASPSITSPATGPPRSAVLPASAALGPTQMVVPMSVEGDWELYLTDTASQTVVRRLTFSTGIDTSPVLSGDRRTVIWVHAADDGRYSLRVAAASDGSGERDLFATMPAQCAGVVSRPAWNPKHPDEVVMGCSDGSKRLGLYLFTVDGQWVRTYAVGSGDVANPTFSPDGRTIAYWAWASRTPTLAGGEIFTLDVDGTGSPRKLTSAASSGQDSDPVYSPSGRYITFSRDLGAGPHLYVMAADGSQQQALTGSPAHDRNPSFSPSGDHIAFRSDRFDVGGSRSTKAFRVWVADATVDGSKMTLGSPRLLLSSGAGDGQGAPAWTRR